MNIIVAACKNKGIGIGNRLPWRLKNELNYYSSFFAFAITIMIITIIHIIVIFICIIISILLCSIIITVIFIVFYFY